MPVVHVSTPEPLAYHRREDLAASITATIAAAHDVTPERIQIFFRADSEEPRSHLTVSLVEKSSTDSSRLVAAIGAATAPHVSPVSIAVHIYPPEDTARGGALRGSRRTHDR